jgi:ribosomal protein S18 acetylase RimI-like enzyme
LDVNIREASPSDQPVIADFNSQMAEETEGKTLDPALVGPGVARLLAEKERGRYWIAEVDGEIVGQIMVTYEWSDWRNGQWWMIQSVFIRDDFRRKGIFSALYKHVKSLAMADTEVCGIRLCVETTNERAQQTYRSLGMTDVGYLVMEEVF